MRKIFIIVVIIVGFSSLLEAQNSEKKEKIKALFVLMHQDSLIIKTIDAMTVSMTKNISSVFNDTIYSNLGIDVSKVTEKLMERSMQKSKENALKLLNEDMVDIYDKYFTIEDIKDFSIFYKSKSGKKLLDKMPDISKDVMNVMTTKYQRDFQQSIMKDIQEITSEMKEKMEKKEE